MWRRLLAIVFVAVGTSGCAFLGFNHEGDKGDTPVEQAEPQAAVTAKPRLKPLAPAPLPSLDPATLIGLDQAEVIAALGEPEKRGDEAPAQVWRYLTDECVVKLFFYLDLGDEEFHLLSYETNQQDGGSDAAKRCFDQVLRGRPRNN